MGGILHGEGGEGNRRTDDGVGGGMSGLECSRSQARPVEIRVGGYGGVDGLENAVGRLSV